MPKKPGGAIQGTFPSLKLKRPVAYSSTLERDLLFELEYELQVTHYQEQPFEVTALLEDGIVHRYTPDYAVWTSQYRTLIECKPERLLTDPHSIQQCQIGKRWTSTNDWRFTVITETDLRTGHRLENLKLLWRYSRFIADTAIVRQMDQLVTERGQVVLSELIQKPSETAIVLHMLFHHRLHTDLSHAIRQDTIVWR